jgi:hypothetical protein
MLLIQIWFFGKLRCHLFVVMEGTLLKVLPRVASRLTSFELVITFVLIITYFILPFLKLFILASAMLFNRVHFVHL